MIAIADCDSRSSRILVVILDRDPDQESPFPLAPPVSLKG
jgi:hypothetical protein